MWRINILLAFAVFLHADAAAVKEINHARQKKSNPPLYFSGTSGRFETPGYSNGYDYPNSWEQSYIIKPSACLNSACMLNLYCEYDIEEVQGCAYDRLVFTSDGTKLCGTNVYNRQNVPLSNGEFPMLFSSDVSEARRGFKINYTVQTVTTPVPTTTTTVVPDARSLIGYYTERYGDSGIFFSPNYPTGKYPYNFDQEYVAHLDSQGAQTVRVVYEYDIEPQSYCLFDYLILGASGSKMCGTKSGTIDIPVADGTFKSFFHSDNSNVKTGFKITYNVLPKTTVMTRSVNVDLPSLEVSPDVVAVPNAASNDGMLLTSPAPGSDVLQLHAEVLAPSDLGVPPTEPENLSVDSSATHSPSPAVPTSPDALLPDPDQKGKKGKPFKVELADSNDGTGKGKGIGVAYSVQESKEKAPKAKDSSPGKARG